MTFKLYRDKNHVPIIRSINGKMNVRVTANHSCMFVPISKKEIVRVVKLFNLKEDYMATELKE